MASSRGGFAPITIKFEGGLDLITPPVSRDRVPGACVLLQNYISDEDGYVLVDGYKKYRTKPVPDGTASPETSGNPIYAIAQGAFSREGGANEIFVGAGLGVLQTDGEFLARVAQDFNVNSAVDASLRGFSDETTEFSSTPTPLEQSVGADIYAFRRQSNTKLGVFRASVDVDGDWITVPIDGDVTPNPSPSLTEALDVPQAGGRVRWISHSFSSDPTPRLFFVTGRGPEFGLYEIVNINGTKAIRGYEIGTEQIAENVDNERKYPAYIQAHQSHLFVGYTGGSIIWSALGDPTNFSAIVGAGAAAFPNIGTQLTGLESGYMRRLWIFGSDSVHYIEGSSAATFVRRTLTAEFGAAADTIQHGTTPIFFSNTGMLQVASGEGVNAGTILLSRALRPYIQSLSRKGVRPTTSMLLRDKDQYRVYFDDGTAIVGALVLRGKRGFVWEFSTLRYSRSVFVASNTSAPRDEAGQYLADRALIAFGREDERGVPVDGDKSDGFVYIDSTPPEGGAAPQTFDGNAIHAAMQLGLQLLRQPTIIKKFNRAIIQGAGDADFEIGLGFGVGNEASGTIRDTPIVSTKLTLPRRNTDWSDRFSGNIPRFDEAGWNEGPWSEAESSANESESVAIPGKGVGFDIVLTTKVSSEDDAQNPPPHRLTGVTIYWKPLRNVG